MPYSHIPPGTEKLLSWLRSQKIRPMIAHPERNKDLVRDFSKVEPLVREGCLFQITAGSLAGDFGQRVQQCAFKFLQRDLVTIIATDAHHLQSRPPLLSKGRDAAAKIVGKEKSWKLVTGNPGKIAASHFSRSPNRLPCIPLA